MINRIIDYSIDNKFIIGLLTFALIGAGIWSMTQVPIDAVPDITNNQVQVITQSPNLGTEDIELFVTYPVEVAMSNLPKVHEIRSISRFGLSVVTIVFDDDMGNYLPRQLVAEKLKEVQEQIPSGFGKPEMGPISTGLGEIYQYTLEVSKDFKDQYTLTELRTMQDWIIRRQMAMVPGVVEVNAFGGTQKQYEVAVDPNELNAIGVTITEIFTALENNNQNTGGAYIERNHQANFIRGEGLARSIGDIENIVVKTHNGIPIKIRDVGEVSLGSAVRYGALTKDGKGEAVGGMILMLKGANSNQVVTKVKHRIEQIQKSMPEGVTITPFLDRSTLITETTGTITGNLLEGGLIVIFVLVLLLGNWRGGLIVASTIPLSLLFAFILMNVFDVWANLMSLGAIDFGIIVDGAVIIVEGSVFLMYSYVVKKKIITKDTQNEIAGKAAKKMMNAAFFGQLIILIVFLPILALEGVEGKMFRPMALTFIFAMIGAMILCLTYVPMVSALFLKAPKRTKESYGDKFVHWVQRKYEPILAKALTKGKLIIGSSIVLFALAVFMFTRMGGEFIPQLDEGDIAFHALLKPGSSLSETVETTTKIEQIVMAQFPEVETVVSRIGVADVPTDPMPMDIADVFVIMKPIKEWTSTTSKDEMVTLMKNAVSILPGVNFEFTQPIEMRFNELLTGVREDVAIKLFGEDLEILAIKAEEIGRLIATVPGVADMKVEAIDGLPQITIDYDRGKLAQYGLNITAVNSIVQAAFAGAKAGVVFEGEKRFDLVVRLNKENRSSITDIQNLYINLSNGSQIPLSEIAKVSYEPGPMQISRDNTNRRTYVGINIRDRDVKSVVKDIQAILERELDLPPGYFIRYGGAFENLERASNKLITVVPIALLLIFVLIYLALKSFPQTLMIYVAIPMATIGGVFALWIRDMPFSISAGIGFIVLFGVAVLNGLVMISGLNELKEEGSTSLKERIFEGTKRRIRPIMLTALTDVLGFLPMAMSSSAGAEVQRPLATVVIGGLLTATLLTLFILPILYQWVENRTAIEASPKKMVPVTVVVTLFLLLPITSIAQQTVPVVASEGQSLAEKTFSEISLQAAIELGVANYPLLKANQLEIEKQQALKNTVTDLGTTNLFTGGEEIRGDDGIYTIVGLGQSDIDVFGIAPNKRLQKTRIQLAETAYDLSELVLIREVKRSWSAAFQANRKYRLYRELDSIYDKFQKSVSLNFEVKAISKLEYSSAKNQALQINNKKQEAYSNYQIALERLNLWLVSDTFYDVPKGLDVSETMGLRGVADLESHPQNILFQKRVAEAVGNYKVSKASMLPKVSLQAGWQEEGNMSKYYSYQAGISMPLLSGLQKRKVKEARIAVEQAKENGIIAERKIKSEYQQAVYNYQKWLRSWQFYDQEALPLAKENRLGGLLAYQEGAIDYFGFTQIIKDAIQTEMDAMDALNNFLNTRFELEYYTK
ncbi:CusA/CzcA family heavy metal efflux RND transporter [Arenibacter sp. 6A1]|uniref:CusA/CzcA family heavy metal efflux RND transporter n=1 Tax=Arenibacter sp. 6A1 TaxID=2720391 RepID=UPI0014488CF2|nr:CusA/CzcA family heavy metal efflux RND transporter [Arenibacter sp. 6A1]NKI27029.1 CusA/CzcA family heavy metal efflux RND transporter [Arenibacter sp. 6A1]